MSVRHTSQENVLHPALAALINDLAPAQLLDYGCGDTRILDIIDRNILIDVHDKNEEMLQLARHRNAGRIHNYFLDRSEILSDEYDAVLVSMVLMTLDNEEEHQDVLETVNRVKKPSGYAYIAVSHPCFRDRQFSNFRTSFGSEQTYSYLTKGVPFNVYLEDDTPPSVAFTDFHWPLSFTLNGIIETGMSIVKLIETPDDASSERCNPGASPFVVIIAK
ncbi:class I SAM-dependent methyltransferase [Leptolyngbya sp. 7M]|uniref:class I SAM-dependent methyltransferase n=1 Tax=Leptolyngbya sp. 7M TaxID=2812896 RepID=UPI001B8D792A|nr:methyltransferase domain-containing protein [Leptolyngbya sp. 7M]QYO65281.1 class I SAM-dependent methyltransferase [Leptolyngbya sp. 7M]